VEEGKVVNLGRRRFVGEFINGSFNKSFFKNLYPFIKIKQFIQDKTTNRILNSRWFIFQLKEKFFISREVSSLPPLLESVDRSNFQFFDIDFPQAEKISIMLCGVDRVFNEKQKISIFYFSDEALQDSLEYDNIAITSLFFKNGIDFLRSTVLKERDR
jgi:hypothetical protein